VRKPLLKFYGLKDGSIHPILSSKFAKPLDEDFELKEYGIVKGNNPGEGFISDYIGIDNDNGNEADNDVDSDANDYNYNYNDSDDEI
jgi:hypothetical protein